MESLNTLWTCFITAVGFVILYSITAVIWFVRLEGKVKSNREIFDVSVQHSLEKDAKVEESIDRLFELIRKVEAVVNRIEGRLNGKSGG